MASVPILPMCTRPASTRVEAYGPARWHPYGALDLTAYACSAHELTVMSLLSQAGFTPIRVPLPAATPHQCGTGFNYRTGRATP